MIVIILGAGVAGSSVAIQLCKAGFNVTIIDITTFPRFRPGESCHPGIEPLLQQLGVWEDVLKINPTRYSSTCVNTNGRETISFFNEDGTWQGFQFHRECFDKILLDKAISLGAEFIPLVKTFAIENEVNTVSSIITNKGEFKFDFLIDATGSKCISSLKLELSRENYSNRIISNYLQISTTERLSDKYKSYFEITDDYWGYIALIKSDTYSVTYSSNDKSPQISKKFFLSRHFDKGYSEIISKSFETSWSITNNRKFENLYLVGDALMTFDPTSSKGILKSIMTSIYAAHIIDSVKANKLTKYQGIIAYQKWSFDFFENELTSIKQLLPITMIKNVFN